MGKTYTELLSEVKKETKEISVQEVHSLLKAGRKLVLLDVRDREEVREGYIEAAVTIPRGFLESRVEERIPDRGVPIVVYCRTGIRSLFAAKTLNTMGYSDVYSMAEGFEGWKRAGLGFVKGLSLSDEQLRRYSRQIALPDFGEEGQALLLKSRVLLIGAGGLGCPAGLYLAAAGVGTIGIVDSDIVDISNLHRQVLHTSESVGKPKTESAKETIRRLNPDVKVITHQVRLTPENALDILKDYDVILDGSDNFPTKYLVNDACFLLGKPNVFGAVFRFEGQATVFHPKAGGPCLRCLFPEPPPPELVPT